MHQTSRQEQLAFLVYFISSVAPFAPSSDSALHFVTSQVELIAPDTRSEAGELESGLLGTSVVFPHLHFVLRYPLHRLLENSRKN
jgi:hypothetical protein